jgi:hypothetical protein
MYLSCTEKREDPTPCAQERIQKSHLGLCAAQMERHNSNRMNVCGGCVLNPPGGGFKPKTSELYDTESTTRPRKSLPNLVQKKLSESLSQMQE